MKTEAKIEERIAELEWRILHPAAFAPYTKEEITRMETQLDTLKWVLVKGYTIWLE